MVGSIIGGALSAVGSIFGGIKASEAMRKVRRNLEERQRENQAWYERRYNEDATQRADAQAALTRAGEDIRRRNRQAEGVGAVMGGTDESVAAAKAANNAALADAVAQIAVDGQNRKDQIEGHYMDTKNDIDNRLNGLEQGRASSIAEAAKGVVNAGSSIAGMFDSVKDYAKDAKEE